jgi:hypothetical protein
MKGGDDPGDEGIKKRTHLELRNFDVAMLAIPPRG